MQTLSQSVAKSTGKKVQVKTQQNPALLGGLQVRIGSKMLDNSIAGKLARLKQKLTEAA
jgi:F-type H+-transporting ATPase subunit delta